MTSCPDILALDIATRCGYARGRIGEVPVAGSVRFGNASTDDAVIFAKAIQWLSEYLQPQPRPDVIAIEAMLTPAAMAKLRNNADVRDRLAGLHGIVRGVASLRGIKQITPCEVGDIRAHFIGTRKLKRQAAKRETMAQCDRLRWAYKDDNSADALACWSYMCALIDPVTALKTVPLFNNALVL